MAKAPSPKATKAQLDAMKAKGWTGFAGITTQQDYEWAMKHEHSSKKGKDFDWTADKVNPFTQPANPFDDRKAAVDENKGGITWGGLAPGYVPGSRPGTGSLTPEQMRLRGMQNAGRGTNRNNTTVRSPLDILADAKYGDAGIAFRNDANVLGSAGGATATQAALPEMGGLVGWAQSGGNRPQATVGPTAARTQAEQQREARYGDAWAPNINIPWQVRQGATEGPILDLNREAARAERERQYGGASWGGALARSAYGLLSGLFGQEYVDARIDRAGAVADTPWAPLFAKDKDGNVITDASGNPETPSHGTAAAAYGGNRQLAERGIAAQPRIDPTTGRMDIERLDANGQPEVSPWYSTRSVPDRMSGAVARVMDIAMRNAAETGDLKYLPLRVTDTESALLGNYLTNHLPSKGMADLEYNRETGKWEWTGTNVFGSNTEETLKALGYEYMGAGFGWLLKPQLGGVAGIAGDGGARGWGGYGGGDGRGRYGYGSQEQGILWRIGIT